MSNPFVKHHGLGLKIAEAALRSFAEYDSLGVSGYVEVNRPPEISQDTPITVVKVNYHDDSESILYLSAVSEDGGTSFKVHSVDIHRGLHVEIAGGGLTVKPGFATEIIEFAEFIIPLEVDWGGLTVEGLIEEYLCGHD